MAMFLFFSGLVCLVIGGLLMLIATFSAGIGWGVFCLLFPPLQLVFIFKYWDKAKSVIVVQTVGVLLIFSAFFVGGQTFTAEVDQQARQYIKRVAPEQLQQLSELESKISPSTFSAIPKPVVSKKPVENDLGTAAIDAAPDGDVRTIYKCVDARGRVTYTELTCAGQQEKAIAVKTDIDDTSMGNTLENFLGTVKEAVEPESE